MALYFWVKHQSTGSSNFSLTYFQNSLGKLLSFKCFPLIYGHSFKATTLSLGFQSGEISIRHMNLESQIASKIKCAACVGHISTSLTRKSKQHSPIFTFPFATQYCFLLNFVFLQKLRGGVKIPTMEHRREAAMTLRIFFINCVTFAFMDSGTYQQTF